MNAELSQKIKNLKLLIADVDGVFTDGSLYIGEAGQEMKRFHVLDGAGVALMKAVNFPMAVISGRNSGVTAARMRELGLGDQLYQGNLAKIEPYNEIKRKSGFTDEEIAYIGDDLVDIPLLRRVGVPFSVANALPEVRASAVYVTVRAGGNGAVREIIELILKTQSKFEAALAVLTKHTYKDI